MSENSATGEAVYQRRRLLLAGLAGTAMAGASIPVLNMLGISDAIAEGEADVLAKDLYPAGRNDAYQVADRPLSDEELVTTYNNFYEFGSHKQISAAAQALQVRPWEVVIDGMVEKEIRMDAEELIRKMPLEERIYRHRCVEAWSMVVPWTGFPLRALIDLAQPTNDAVYLKMTTFENPDIAPGQRQSWYPWPYVEGLTMDEARNDLAFIATGIYGRPMPKQNGSPLRLAVPWKYGFKSVKSIVRFTFTNERPVSFWEEIQDSEYGFWGNVNPEVPHPRWSQADEKPLGSKERIPTLLFNGYEEQVAGLYPNITDVALYR